MHSRTRKHQGSLCCLRGTEKHCCWPYPPQDCSCKCPVLSKELFAVKSLVHGVILKIFLEVGWKYLAKLNINIGEFKFGDPWKNLPK